MKKLTRKAQMMVLGGVMALLLTVLTVGGVSSINSRGVNPWSVVPTVDLAGVNPWS